MNGHAKDHLENTIDHITNGGKFLTGEHCTIIDSLNSIMIFFLNLIKYYSRYDKKIYFTVFVMLENCTC